MSPVDGYDPFDPKHRTVPFDLPRRIRQERPISRVASGPCFVSRYHDVEALLKDHQSSLSSGASRATGVEVDEEDKFLFEIDPPRHSWFRRLLSSVLTVRKVEGHGLSCEQGELTEKLVAKGGFEAAFPEFVEYVDREVDARRAAQLRGNDMIARLAGAEIDGRALTRGELRQKIISVITGGAQTTADLTSSLLYELLQRPELWRVLRVDRSFVPVAVDEALRDSCPVIFTGRTATRDVEIRGVEIAAGERLLAGLLSANREETVYPDPDEFRLHQRGQSKHLSFGAGAHFCIGAALARAEAAAALEAFLDRISQAEVVSEGDASDRQSAVPYSRPALRITIP